LVMHSGIGTTINAQAASYLDEKKLARMLKNMQFDTRYALQIFNFFTDVPLQDLARFLVQYEIPEVTLKAYYEKYVKEFYAHRELEEMLADVAGSFCQGTGSP